MFGVLTDTFNACFVGLFFLALYHAIYEGNVLHILFRKEKGDKFSEIFFPPNYIPIFLQSLVIFRLN